MYVRIIDPHAPTWSAELDRMGLRLRDRDDVALFPYHFLQVTLPRIGGCAAWIEEDGTRIGAAFIFPRQRDRGGAPVFTFRYHFFRGVPAPPPDLLANAARNALEGSEFFAYDPLAMQAYASTHKSYGAVEIGRPDADEAAAIPALHAAIWGSPPEFIYPADIHSINFAAATSLVARVDRRPVGFLLGFAKFGGRPLPADWHERFGGDYRIESQIMGVLPAYRGLRIAHLLKQAQAEYAWREGIGIVNWTADPLQYPNAALNFGLLRAVAFHFIPDLYPFRNNLNRVAASRFSLAWLVGTARVRATNQAGGRTDVLDLAHHPAIARVNDGWAILNDAPTAATVAIEIPANWTTLQSDDVPAAMRWREVTDGLFRQLIGLEDGRYVITNAAVHNERRFLIAERACPTLWGRLGEVQIP
jgi:predicted GNAT superfamily acetyltransferase